MASSAAAILRTAGADEEGLLPQQVPVASRRSKLALVAAGAGGAAAVLACGVAIGLYLPRGGPDAGSQASSKAPSSTLDWQEDRELRGGPRGVPRADGKACQAVGGRGEREEWIPEGAAKGWPVAGKACWLAQCPRDAAWIVVGGGGAGCAAAAALADRGEDVLVLERGPNDKDVPSTQTMGGWPKSVNDASELIRFKEGVWGVVAKVLGGGTSVNGGLYLADRPEWFTEHMPDVDQTEMYASYEKVARELAYPVQPTPFGADFNEALTQAGYGVADLENPSLMWTKGRPWLPYSTFNQSEPHKPRHGAAALLHNRKGLSNLRVVTDAAVQQVNFHGHKATGVKVLVGHGWRQRLCPNVKASKGVIVSAGAIKTPQLLQVSGVGPRHIVEGLGQKVVADQPVGESFTDRLAVPLGTISPQPLDLTVGYTALVDEAKNQLIEGVGGGDITSELAVTSIGVVAPEQRTPLLRSALKTIFALLPTKVMDFINQMVQPVALQTNTHSRGSVYATSTDVADPPKVTANYFKDERDWQSQKERLKTLLSIAKEQALEGYSIDKATTNGDVIAELVRELAPELAAFLSCFWRVPDNKEYTKIALPCLPFPYDDQEALDTYLRSLIVSSYHYFGTTSRAVDQADFSVKGTRHLHVIDASVIPVPTTINPQATVMALGDYLGRLLGRTQGHTGARKDA